MSQRIDPETLAELPEPQGVSLSPDGQRIVYSLRPFWCRQEEHLKASLWVAQVGQKNSAKQLTQGDYNDCSPQFSPDGDYISFLTDRSRPGKGTVLYLLPVEGGEAFPLTSRENEMGIGSYAWRPDSKLIAFASADEKSEERKQRENDKDDGVVHGENLDCLRLRTVDVHTKEVRNLKTGDESVGVLAWNSRGTHIAFATHKGPTIYHMDGFGSRVNLVDVEKDVSRELHHFETIIGDIIWDGENIMWSGNYLPESRTTSRGLFRLSPKDTGKGVERLSYGKTNCSASLKSCSGKAVVKVMEGMSDIIETLEGAELCKINKNLSCFDVSFQASQATIALAYGTSGLPVEVYSMVNGDTVQLSQHGKHVADKYIGKSVIVEYTHDDGTPIDGFYSVPTAHEVAFDEGKPRPTAVVVHGGPYSRSGDCFDLYFSWTPWLLSLGYLVLVPNYRGGAGHGHDYADAVRGDASNSYQDVLWLIKKGIEEGRIDKDRVAIMGWSQGGFMSYLASTRDDEFHYQAIIAGAGVSDWSTMALTSDVPVFESAVSGTSAWMMDSIDDVQSRKCSPIFYMKNVNSPMLLLHGELDPRVPVEQARGFYRGMIERGKDVTMVTYPRETHGWPMPFEKKHYVDMLLRLESFLEKHLGKA